MTAGRRIFFGTVGTALFAVLWEALTRGQDAPHALFPPLSAIVAHGFELLTSLDFISDQIGASLLRLAIAMTVVVPFSVVLALAAALWEIFGALISPLIDFLYPLPKVAIFPLMLAIFGLGDRAKIVLIGIGIFFPMYLSVYQGALRLKRSEYRDLVSIYRMSGYKLYYLFYFKGLTGDFLTGFKISLGYGFTLVVVSEMTASNNGIGNFIWRAWDSFNILDLYAGVLILCLMGWLAQTAFGLAHRRFTTPSP